MCFVSFFEKSFVYIIEKFLFPKLEEQIMFPISISKIDEQIRCEGHDLYLTTPDKLGWDINCFETWPVKISFEGVPMYRTIFHDGEAYFRNHGHDVILSVSIKNKRKNTDEARC